MWTFEQYLKPKSSSIPIKTKLPVQACVGPDCTRSGKPAIQRSIGNQAVQRLQQTNANTRNNNPACAPDASAILRPSSIPSRLGRPLQPTGKLNSRHNGVAMSAGVHEVARHGQRGGARSLPYLATLQSAFGRHALSGVRAYVGGPAAEANAHMHSSAYTCGEHIAFRQMPDLFTAAHEAAHIVQQRAGVRLPGGVGTPGDPYECHADAVAGAVVKGESAASLLDAYRPTGPARADQVQHQDAGTTATSQAQDCAALRAALANSNRVIALYQDFLAGKVNWDTVMKSIKQIGNAAQGVTGAGQQLPQVVQDAVAEVERFDSEEIRHMGRLTLGIPSVVAGSGDFFHRQWVTNEIERQQHFNLVLIESMYAHHCPDYPGTWRGYQEQVLPIGTTGMEQRSTIESPQETHTALAWVAIGGEHVLVLATEVAGAGRLRFERWIDSGFRDLALQQARENQGAIPTVPAAAVTGLPASVPSSAARL